MGKRTFLIVGLALALATTTFHSTQSLARGDSSPTDHYTVSLGTAGWDHYDLQPAYVQNDAVIVEAMPVKFAEAKVIPIEKYAGVATLVQLRSWRVTNERNYGEDQYGEKTTVVNLPEKRSNTARWKDLHRRSC